MRYSWRWCFYINLPPGAVVATILFFTRVPEGQVVKPNPTEVVKDLHNKLDLVGFFLFAPSCIMLLLAMQWGGNEYPWDSATVIGLFCGFAGNLIVWAIWNYYKRDKALIPFSMVGNTTVWTSCIFLGILMGSMFGMCEWSPQLRNASLTILQSQSKYTICQYIFKLSTASHQP